MIADPRNTEWFLLRTPEAALLVVAAYLIFVLVGPRIMSSRPPLNMRSLIVAYNFAMVVMSAYMCAEVGVRLNLTVTVLSLLQTRNRL